MDGNAERGAGLVSGARVDLAVEVGIAVGIVHDQGPPSAEALPDKPLRWSGRLLSQPATHTLCGGLDSAACTHGVGAQADGGELRLIAAAQRPEVRALVVRDEDARAVGLEKVTGQGGEVDLATGDSGDA